MVNNHLEYISQIDTDTRTNTDTYKYTNKYTNTDTFQTTDILNFNKKYVINSNNYAKYNIKHDTILDTILDTIPGGTRRTPQYINLYQQYKSILKNSIITVNGHQIVHCDTYITTLFDKLQTKQLYIEIVPRIKGGGLIDVFMSIIQIGKVFLFLGDIIVWFLKFIVWFIFFIMWVLKFMLVDLTTDFYNSLVIIIVTIFKLPLDIFTAIGAFTLNSIGGWMTTIWGWDQSNLTSNDKNSNYFRDIDRTKGKKCYLTNKNTVPFSILIGTIICPPLGVFMDVGLTGWFNILICTLLTLCFYIPGLFYALLIIYS